MLIVNNPSLSGLIRDSYSIPQVDELFRLLGEHGTFRFSRLAGGVFPAASPRPGAAHAGYSHAWVRDNVYVALAHYLNGRNDLATETVKALAAYFLKHKWRFEAIIEGRLDRQDPANRPRIRFEGSDLSEIDPQGALAENDALGYFLWLFCLLRNRGVYPLSEAEQELLALFAHYFQAIRYWEDEDSGHWEETPKIEASSIGVVIRALEELKALAQREGGEALRYGDRVVTADMLDPLIASGRASLDDILPAEAIQTDLAKNRLYDAALLFLIFPMNVVSEETADQILHNVTTYLQGDYGIRRYLGDAFWSPGHRPPPAPGGRTRDADDSAERSRLPQEGEEAQWCLFDPILSIIYGLRYRHGRDESDLELQIRHFNRSLGQLTGEDSRFGGFQCPELYYREHGVYVPNDAVSLLWTQANLWMAFRFLRENLAQEESGPG